MGSSFRVTRSMLYVGGAFAVLALFLVYVGFAAPIDLRSAGEAGPAPRRWWSTSGAIRPVTPPKCRSATAVAAA